MPIYMYRCEACGHRQEVIAKMSDPPPETCKSCQAKGQMKKEIGRTGVQLKGGGWYKQGYNGQSNSSSSSSTSSSSSSSSSDS